MSALLRWRDETAAPPLEVRDELDVPAFERRRVGTRHILDLESDADAVFNRFERHRIQSWINRAQKQGVVAVISNTREDLAAFYDLHCLTRRRQGVPVQPRRFFENLFACIVARRLGFVVLASLAGKPVAGAVFLASNRQLMYKFGASDRSDWVPGANHLVMWTAMRWGCEAGYQSVDLGRTDEGHESLRLFKARWGAREVPLVYSYVGAAPRSVGSGRASRAMARIIRRSPTVVCRTVGELLYRFAA